MINRNIIRIKTLQIVYAYNQRESKDIVSAENELMFSLQKSYDLYHSLLLLIPAITDLHQKQLDKRKHKYLPSEEEKNPNMRLANNRLSEQLIQNKQLTTFSTESGSIWNSNWVEDSGFLRHTLNRILKSDVYAAYLESSDDYESDREFWRKTLKTIILPDEALSELLEESSIYWNDDLEIIGTFALKTIKHLREKSQSDEPLLPMFKDEEDKAFALDLLRQSIIREEEFKDLIEKYIKNWEIERIAIMDLLIMQIAITELLTFPSIPINVTLNEYIDIAKFYSTAQSGHFINGTLDAIVTELKKDNLLFKL